LWTLLMEGTVPSRGLREGLSFFFNSPKKTL
jgi:hypothetical protein